MSYSIILPYIEVPGALSYPAKYFVVFFYNFYHLFTALLMKDDAILKPRELCSLISQNKQIIMHYSDKNIHHIPLSYL